MKYANKKIISVMIVLLMIMLLGIIPQEKAYADEYNHNYESRNVIDDLTGSIINGKTFDINDYPYNINGRPTVLMFAEYGYSFYASNCLESLGLYLYIYNPQARKYVIEESEFNKISISCGNDTNYHKYPLVICNYSTDSINAGLFYKFKIILSDEQKTNILNSLSVERKYQLSSIELTQKDSAGSKVYDTYTVNSTYIYNGYASGYGIKSDAESTLTCSVTGFEEYLGLEVGYTSYVVDGDTDTRDMLMSVYFSVPTDYVKAYGDLYAVKATWLKAMTSWGAVIGYEDAYNAISPKVNKSISSDNYPQYALITDFAEHRIDNLYYWTCSNIYNKYVVDDYMEDPSWNADGAYLDINTVEVIDRLDYIYSSSFDEVDSADKQEISSYRILQTIKDYTAAHPNETKVGDKYSASMFSLIAEDYTEVEYSTDEKDDFSLEKVTISQDFWQKLFGTNTESSVTYDGIKAIQRIYSSDFSENKNDIKSICNKLYIGTSDYWTIKEYVDDKTSDTDKDGIPDNAVYLFRFDIADYYSSEAAIAYYSANTGFLWMDEIVTASTNAYLFKTPVYINFDIIQLTFRNSNSIRTVVPVVMKPIDIVGTVIPPAQTSGDEKDRNLFKYIMLIVVLIIVAVILSPILPYVFKAIAWIICLPFKAIAALLKAITHHKNE